MSMTVVTEMIVCVVSFLLCILTELSDTVSLKTFFRFPLQNVWFLLFPRLVEMWCCCTSHHTA